jgi:ABC-type nitrate/sulfonate/bicarbonate transport system substrate-binding protein
VRNTFSYAAAPTITTFAQLNGKRVAVHSPVSFTKTVTDALIKKYNITGTTELIIQGSDVRLQALLDKQIDATTVDLADIVRLRATVGESAVRLLGTVSAEFPELLYTVVAMRSDFIKNEPALSQAILKAFAQAADKMNNDGAYALSLAEKNLPQEKPEVRKAIVEAFRQAGVWNAKDLTQASAASTMKFLYDYKATDINPSTIKLENYFDFSVAPR